MDVEDLKHVLDPQIRCNMAIAEEGLKGNYGANIGSVLLAMNGDDIRTRARAWACLLYTSILGGRHQVDVVGALFLELQEDLSEPGCGNFFSEIFMAQRIVLAENAF